VATYSYAQLQQLWIAAGGDPSVAPMAATIALAESGGDPNAVNYNCNAGSAQSSSSMTPQYCTTGVSTIDYGLWQMNSYYWGGSPADYDPMTCARLAVSAYKKSGNTFAPWHGDRAYEYSKAHNGALDPQFTGGGSNSSPSANAAPTNPLGWLQQEIQQGENAISGIAGGIEASAANFLQALFGGAVSPFLRLPQSLINIGWNFGGFAIGWALVWIGGLLLVGFVFEEGFNTLGAAIGDAMKGKIGTAIVTGAAGAAELAPEIAAGAAL
jgi:hypothetical protein